MINIKTLAKNRATEINKRVFNENEFILFYQAHGIKPVDISKLTKSIKDIDSDLQLTHIPSSRIAKVLFSWDSQELQAILQGPTWAISSNNSESFNKLIGLKDEKLTLLGGICEGHIISANVLKNYTKIGNKPYTHITKLHHGLHQVLNTIHKGMAYDLAKTIKQANKGE